MFAAMRNLAALAVMGTPGTTPYSTITSRLTLPLWSPKIGGVDQPHERPVARAANESKMEAHGPQERGCSGARHLLVRIYKEMSLAPGLITSGLTVTSNLPPAERTMIRISATP